MLKRAWNLHVWGFICVFTCLCAGDWQGVQQRVGVEGRVENLDGFSSTFDQGSTDFTKHFATGVNQGRDRTRRFRVHLKSLWLSRPHFGLHASSDPE